MIYNISTAYFSYAYQTEKGEFHMKDNRERNFIVLMVALCAICIAALAILCPAGKVYDKDNRQLCHIIYQRGTLCVILLTLMKTGNSFKKTLDYQVYIQKIGRQ